MKTASFGRRALAALVLLHPLMVLADPLGSAVSYQGQLKNAGVPANGNFNMVFALFDAQTLGNQVGPTLTFDGAGGNPPPVAVANGLFTVQLDFGAAAYDGNKRWLDITVAGTPLTPRQEFTAAPYARFSAAPWATTGDDISYSDGKVGIGTNTPANALSISGDADISGLLKFPGATPAALNQVRSPTSATSSTWSTPENIFTSDDQDALRILPECEETLTGSGFGFSLPLNAVVTGIVVRLEMREVPDIERAYECSLSLVGGAGSSEDRATSVVLPASDQIVSFGGPSDLWGLTWTPAEINNPAFGAMFSAFHQTGYAEAHIDHMEIEVFYDASATDAQFEIGVNGPGLGISVDGSNIMALNVYGNVGIGTTSPNSKLSVVGDIEVTGSRLHVNPSGNVGIGEASPTAMLQLGTGPDFANVTTLGVAMRLGDTVGLSIRGASGGSDPALQLCTSGGSCSYIGLSSTGNMYLTSPSVGIGTTSPSQKLHVVGNICATGTIGACSDSRFKKNVLSLTDALDAITQLRGVTFDWKRDEFRDHHFAEGPQIGFIAQEVETVLPQVVAKGSDGYLSVDYGRLTPVIVEAMKELRAENTELKLRLEKLESRLSALTHAAGGGAR